jgi:hypothetical protein
MDKEKPIMQPDLQHQRMQRREPLEQYNAIVRRRFQVLMALAFLALVGALFLSQGSGKAIAQQGGDQAGHPTLPARVADLEAKLGELQNQINNISSKPGPAGPQEPIHREDCYGFELDRLSVNHQGKNVLHLTVLYRYAPGLKTADYMDVNELRKSVLETIRAYPNTTDYWEIYNARIADKLFACYADQLDALRVKLEIASDTAEPFRRTSLVVRSHPGSPPLIP